MALSAVPGAPAAPLLLLLPLAALLLALAGALPASLLRDVRRAETLRASAPGPLAAAASAPAPVRAAARATRAAPAPAAAYGIDAATEKAAAAAVAAAAAAGRPKRDLGVDPEKLLALLALWQQQQQLPQRSPLDVPLEASLAAPLTAPLSAPLTAPLYRPAGRIPGYDLSDADDWELSMDNNDLDSEDEGPVGAWLEAPPFAQARPAPLFAAQRRASFYLPALPPPPPAAPLPNKHESAWAGLAKEKRFMVSRKRQVGPLSREGSVRYLARLLAPPPRNPGVPLVRRVLL